MQQPRLIRQPVYENDAPGSDMVMIIPGWSKVITMVGMSIFFVGALMSTCISGIDFDYSDYGAQRMLFMMAALISQVGLMLLSFAMIYIGLFIKGMDFKTRRLCLGMFTIIMVINMFIYPFI